MLNFLTVKALINIPSPYKFYIVINIGQINNLTVNRITSVGMFLTDGEGNDVLLPNKYIPETLSVNDTIDVFIYNDSEDRIIATLVHLFTLLKQSPK